jgi:hypothetical protein
MQVHIALTAPPLTPGDRIGVGVQFVRIVAVSMLNTFNDL